MRVQVFSKQRRRRHPVQPLIKAKDGVIRFKKNAIVEFLLERGGFDMNDIACMTFPNEDREQFAQLIGYSLSGFSELSYVSRKTYREAETQLAPPDREEAI